MGNKNAKKINQDAEDEGRRINREGDRFDDYAWGGLPQARDKGRKIADRQYGVYDEILDNKYAGRSVERGAGMGGGGNLRGYEDYFKNFGGGIDETAQNRIRGGGKYDEYSRTGGFNPAQETDFINRATGAVPKFYEAIQNDMDRMKGVQGGYSPGFDAQSAKIAREKTQAGQDAILNANVDLKNIKDANTRWGTEGMTASETGLQDMLTRNKLQSMGSAAGLAQARGDMDFRDAQAQRDDDYRWTFGALGGLQDMYGAVPGEENMYMDQINNGRQIRGGQQGANLDRRMQYNPNRSFMDQVGQGLGAVAPIFSAFGGGFGNNRGGSRGQPGGPTQDPFRDFSPDANASGYGRQNFSRFQQGQQVQNPFQQYQRGFGTNPQQQNPFRRY